MEGDEARAADAVQRKKIRWDDEVFSPFFLNNMLLHFAVTSSVTASVAVGVGWGYVCEGVCVCVRGVFLGPLSLHTVFRFCPNGFSGLLRTVTMIYYY